MIQSKKSITGFYLPALSKFIFYILISGLIFYSFKEELNTVKYIVYNLLLGPLFILLGFYTLYIALKEAFTFYISYNKILVSNIFSKKEFFWDEIETIRLTGKTEYKNIFNEKKEAASIVLKNGEKIEIIDRYYSNTHQIKYSISCYLSTKQLPKDFHENPIHLFDYKKETWHIFKGNPLLNFWTFPYFALTCFIVFLAFEDFFPSGRIHWQILIAFLPFMYLFSSYGLYYFVVSDKYLIVNNHFIPWIKKIYSLDQIEEIVFDDSGNLSKKLRITTKKFCSTQFHAFSLRSKTWKKLKDNISKKEIKIRIEA